MTDTWDVNDGPIAEWRRVTGARRAPLLSQDEVGDVLRVFRALPRIQYPIESGSHLLDQIGMEHEIRLGERGPSSLMLVLRMPAHYFPIVTPDNFAEKIAALIREVRKTRDLSRESKVVLNQLKALKFPVASPASLMEMLAPRRRSRGGAAAAQVIKFGPDKLQLANLLNKAPAGVFPIKSKQDLRLKVTNALASRSIFRDV